MTDITIACTNRCPTYPVLREGHAKNKLTHSEDSVTVAKVNLWLGHHGYLLAIASFVNHLTCCMTPILQWKNKSRGHNFGLKLKNNPKFNNGYSHLFFSFFPSSFEAGRIIAL